jgi:diaminohydroxyphosphoribosylaminopyrimidine deaminase/5-amino-6-(5-phosphoribosylamino)uracil reductase
MAADDGSSQWISSPESRDDVQILRSHSDAILTGTGTVLADNPTLQARIDGAAQPLRVVVGERDIPADFNINNEGSQTLLLQSRDLNKMVQALSDRDINQVLVEAGPTLGTALLKAGIIDEILIYQAPTLLGSGKSWLQDLGIETLAGAQRLNLISSQQLASDIKSRYRVEKR